MKLRIIALSVLAVATILVIAQSLPISQFPNTPTPLDSDLFVLAQTQAPKTNKNTRYDQLRGAIRSGMATETYVNNATNGLATTNYANQVASNRVVVLAATNTTVVMTSTNGTNFYAVSSSVGGAVLWTNSGGIVMLTTNGPVSIASTGLLGGLVVTQDMRILGHNSASNSVWVCTNATTGEGEWRASTAAAGFGSVATNSDILNLQYEPVRGSTWYSGTNGTPTTNEARAGLEFSPFWRSLRMGQVANGNVTHPSTYGGQGSNYWNNTNIGPVTVAFGSNVSVRSAYSSVGGGAMNLILSNSTHSVIAGGYNNLIDTNLPTATIGGGGFNQIYGRPTAAGGVTISGGSNNIINAATIEFSTIGGGGDNTIEARFATISGGSLNKIENTSTPADYAFIGGGVQNQVGENGGTDASTYGVVCGGNANLARGLASFIGGGAANNLLANDNDYCVIVGGQGNAIGIAAGELESKWAFVGGGTGNAINDASHYSVVVGGRDNTISSGSNTNGFIGGGAFNNIGNTVKFASILGGERNSITGIGTGYGFAIGTSNSVTASRAGAIGMNVTNSTAGSVTVGELISYNTPAVIAGAGSGSTNYLLAVTSPKMLLGSSNVHIYGLSGTIAGKTHNWSVNITNLSGDTWGIGFSSGTNRWRFQSYMYGTSAPVVLTNNTLLRLNGASEGTNTLVTYEYFSPAL